MTYVDEQEFSFDRSMDLVGYVYDGEIYCIGCVPPTEGCECEVAALDEKGICMSNCSGLGPHEVIRGEVVAKKRCLSCFTLLKETR